MLSVVYSRFQVWLQPLSVGLRLTTLATVGCMGVFTLGAIAPVLAQQSPSDLTDINDHWAELCIQNLYQRKVVTGYPDHTFRPNEPVTRAEFAVMLDRAFPDHPDRFSQKTYRDVDETYWGLISIYHVTETGFMTGYRDGTFAPSRNIPRYEVLLALVSGLNYSPQTAPQTLIPQYYDDAAMIPAFAYRAIAAATEKRLVVNYPNVHQLNPLEWASRAGVASFLCRALDTSGTIPAQFIAGDRPIPFPNRSRTNPTKPKSGKL